jgi:predicted chitinase
MPVKFNVNNAVEKFKKYGGKTTFPDSLKQVLTFIQNDPNFNTINEVGWLLATAKLESNYSLQRWEADYLCGDAGVPYKNQPCDRAIRYYKSTDGKKNYFDLGTDKNGMAYFGRGLIQLTGKSNYDTYGKLIGVDLINDGDKAMIPKNSYKIASEFFKRKRGSAKKSVNDYANEGDFAMARKRVKGSSSGWENAKDEFDLWMEVFNDKDVKFKRVKKTKKQRRRRILIPTLTTFVVVGVAVGFWYFTRPKK